MVKKESGLILVLALFLVSFFYPSEEVFVKTEPDKNEAYLTFAEDFFEDAEFRASREDLSIPYLGLEFMQNQTIAIENLQKIQNSFKKTKTGDILYPDYYGGSYIDEEGKLVTLIVDGYKNMDIINRAGIAENKWKTVQFSHNEIIYVYNTIYDFVTNNLENQVAKNVTNFSQDTKGNRIVVGLKNLSEKQIELFKSTIIDSPTIDFEYATELTPFLANSEIDEQVDMVQDNASSIAPMQ